MAIDAIAWIIARSDDEVSRVFCANMPIDGSAPRRASEIVEDIASRHAHMGWGVGNTLFWAWEQLASALCGARLSVWRWNKTDDNLLKLPPDAYFKALSINDTNSAGMFRMDSISNLTDFLLLLPEEVRSLWPADHSGSQSPLPGVADQPIELPFTEAEIRKWINGATQTNMKKARDAFMKEPRAKGLTGAFESVWRDIYKRGRGRPRKSG